MGQYTIPCKPCGSGGEYSCSNAFESAVSTALVTISGLGTYAAACATELGTEDADCTDWNAAYELASVPSRAECVSCSEDADPFVCCCFLLVIAEICPCNEEQTPQNCCGDRLEITACWQEDAWSLEFYIRDAEDPGAGGSCIEIASGDASGAGKIPVGTPINLSNIQAGGDCSVCDWDNDATITVQFD